MCTILFFTDKYPSQRKSQAVKAKKINNYVPRNSRSLIAHLNSFEKSGLDFLSNWINICAHNLHSIITCHKHQHPNTLLFSLIASHFGYSRFWLFSCGTLNSNNAAKNINSCYFLFFFFLYFSFENEFLFNRYQVTPPEEPLPVLGVPCMHTGMSGGINPSSFGGSTLGLSTIDNCQMLSAASPLQGQSQSEDSQPQSIRTSQSPQHLQGTIVWYNLMWGRRLRSAVGKNKWI